MPKEDVRDQASLYDVRVGWERNSGYVQVGIETADGRSIAKHLTGDGETPADFSGLWGTLDRDGCNRLIRTVRRARDAAFGADE